MMMVTPSLERETHFLRGRFFPLQKKYSLQRQNCVQLIFFYYFPCYGSNGNCHLFLFYALVDIVIRFFDTDLSLLICFSVIEFKRKEVVTVTSVRYSCKTLKTSKMNDIVWVKKDKLKPYDDQRLQRINAG